MTMKTMFLLQTFVIKRKTQLHHRQQRPLVVVSARWVLAALGKTCGNETAMIGGEQTGNFEPNGAGFACSA